MKFYADLPARRTLQATADIAALAWIVLLVWAASSLHGAVVRLAEPGAVLENAGDDLHSRVASAANTVGDLPAVGGTLRKPFDAVAASGLDIAAAGIRQQQVVSHLAAALTLLVVVIAVGVLLLGWLPWRLRWVLRARAAQELLGTGGDRDLLALRALANRPLRQLRQVSTDPAAAWRAGDPAVTSALADIELASLGLRDDRVRTVA